MASKLYYIPNKNFTKAVNDSIYESEEVIISVSFAFKAGLNLIKDRLFNFPNKARLTIIVSNYMKSTEPEAL